MISVLREEVRSQPAVAGSYGSAFRTDRRDSVVVKSEPSSLTFNAADADDEGSLSLPQHFFFLFYASKFRKSLKISKCAKGSCYFFLVRSIFLIKITFLWVFFF